MTMATDGSSPLTRGKPRAGCLLVARDRLIPAHAGKTCGAPTSEARTTAHPRSRGENHRCRAEILARAGSSPLTRGKPAFSPRDQVKRGLIPAHAGKTAESAHPACPRPAHPRSRGENLSDEAEYQWRVGSSPLTRGKRIPYHAQWASRRLIPAHAGKTAKNGIRRRRVAAHPRSRGENDGD